MRVVHSVPATMFCPNCKAEYRPGFTRCADCDVELVYELAKEAAPGGSEAGDLQSVWHGNDQAECVSLCLALKKAAIPYEVSQSVASRSIRMRVDWKYEIAVSSSDHERARKILRLEDEPDEGEPEELHSEDKGEDEDEGGGSWEFPAVDDAGVEAPKSDAYLREWYPEDATVEVWSESAADESSGVELCLKENYIHFRSDKQEDGSLKVFVMPADEARARQIVREILEGPPLE
jgi:hypothetical protein